MNDSTTTEKIRALVEARGMVRARDVEKAGFSSRILYRLRDRGELIQLGPGLFTHPASELTERHSFAAAALLVPRGVVCLLSALAFHEIGTQLPRSVWLALDRTSRSRPNVSHPPMEFVWFSGDSFSEGQEVHRVEGVDVSVYSPAKTVADLFKYRRKLGTDVALEALTEGWRERHFTIDELMHYAAICRVKTIIMPYVQSLVAGS